jgi:ABC-type uncharacterized transport system ATPase subunit
MNNPTELTGQNVVLQVEGVTKRFPGVLANDDVSLTLHQGEILALLGENGAGKSTLMNIIYGLYHPDEGTIRIKGREVRFASPREAIRSGIGMVHQHFQLVNVMTVAENVVLGEEADVAYQGKGNPVLNAILRWLPSIAIFLLVTIFGLALGEVKYLLGGIGVGLLVGLGVAFPTPARLVWGIAWRVGLVFAALWLASQVETATRMGLTGVALRQKVEVVRERTQELDGFAVKTTEISHERIEFDWRREARDADDAGLGIDGVIESAKAQMVEFRDKGIPGWLLDAIDDVPPDAQAVSAVVLLLIVGWHSLSSWRGINAAPRRLESYDLAILAALVLIYAVFGWLRLDRLNDAVRLGLTAVIAAGLGVALWRTYTRRQAWDKETISQVSPVDSALDAFISTLRNLTQIRNERLAARRVHELSQQYGLEVDPDAVIEKLPVGTQQRVEIVKALYRQADILILDEPTAVLTPQEGKELFKIMRELASQGVSIIFITHKLKEVFEVASHIVVMRDGRVVGTTTPAQATEASLAEMMVGREVILQVEKEEAHPQEPVLLVSDLNAYNDRGAKALNDVSFDVCAGEVLGIAGVQGNGQTELVEVLTGLREASGGSVQLLGMELQPDVQPEGQLWTRVWAFVIDMAIVLGLTYFVAYFVSYFGESTFEDTSTATRIAVVVGVGILVDALYFLGGWKVAASTVGMALFSLQIATIDDKKPRFPRLILRYLIFLALRLPLGIPALISFALARQDAQHRNWFDRQLGLRVIRRERITPRRIKDIGTSHVPEDRQRHGLVKDYSVADNLVLNDFYERPFAKEPNVAELPGAVLRYAVIFGLIVGGLTALAVWFWDHTLWEALLDAYRVPESLRTYSLSTALPPAQSEALQWPILISVVLLVGSELVFGVIAHFLTAAILSFKPVGDSIRRVERTLRQGLWSLLGQDGQVGEPQGGLLRAQEAILGHANRLIEQYDIRTPSAETEGGSLSGGNQQKMIVAREFSRQPRLLIAAQPTRGIDVGSIEFIHRQIIDQRDAGAAVLLVSAELDEIMALSDRIAVMYKGAIIDTVPAGQATREQLGLLMAGIRSDRATPEAV